MEGMNDVISKILEKPQAAEQNNVILSKSKKTKRKRSELKEELASKKEKLVSKSLEREIGHVLPTRSNAQNEILFKRIASRGVVKLFNAVSAHQKTMSAEMKTAKTEGKKEKKAKVIDTKSNFMDLLKKKDSTQAKAKLQENPGKDSSESWKVFRDDFMMGASMKDWDKKAEDNLSSDDPHEQSDSGSE